MKKGQIWDISKGGNIIQQEMIFCDVCEVLWANFSFQNSGHVVCEYCVKDDKVREW